MGEVRKNTYHLKEIEVSFQVAVLDFQCFVLTSINLRVWYSSESSRQKL
jgi:hypothetical protein